jgi:hypothetical protein
MVYLKMAVTVGAMLFSIFGYVMFSSVMLKRLHEFCVFSDTALDLENKFRRNEAWMKNGRNPLKDCLHWFCA